MHLKTRQLAAWAGRSLVRPLRRFARHQRGTAAIEFPLILLPFAAFIFAIMETAMVFFGTQVLETGVQDAARLVLTGQAQGKGFNKETFKIEVCKKVTGWLECNSNRMQMDVRTFNDFSSVSMVAPLKTDGSFSDSVYQPGGPGDIVVVRLLYQFPIAFRLWNPNLANMQGNSRLLVATAAFKNEPY
jgi:Flp pilus assembly protein TadG